MNKQILSYLIHKKNGSLTELRKIIEDHGISIDSLKAGGYIHGGVDRDGSAGWVVTKRAVKEFNLLYGNFFCGLYYGVLKN